MQFLLVPFFRADEFKFRLRQHQFWPGASPGEDSPLHADPIMGVSRLAQTLRGADINRKRITTAVLGVNMEDSEES